MPWIIAMLVSWMGTLVGRVLLALGIGVVSYLSIGAMANNLIADMQTNYNSMPTQVLGLLNLAGFGVVLGTLSSALVTRATMMAIKRFLPV